MKTTKIHHPKTNELFGIITETHEGFWSEVGKHEDVWSTFNEAKDDILNELEYIYSGKATADDAADKRYARQEQIACGNY